MSDQATFGERSEVSESRQHPATVAIYLSAPPEPIRLGARQRWPRVYVTEGFALRRE